MALSKTRASLMRCGAILLAFSLWASADEEKGDAAAKPQDAGLEIKWKVVYNVKTGSMPKAVVLTPDEKQAWVTNFGNSRGHNLTVFDAGSGEIKERISFRGRAVELAFSHDGSRAYVSNFDTGRLLEIDTGTYQVARSARVGVNPKIVTLSPSGETIYVSNWSSNDVSIVDGASLRERARIRVGRNPRGSDTDLAGEKLFVANFNGYSLSVVDLKAKKLVKTIPMKRMPRHVTSLPDGSFILVSCMGRGANAVAVVDAEELEVEQWIEVGRGPKTIQVSPEGKIAFTADYFGHLVSMIDLEKGESIATIPDLGRSPCGMALSGDGRTLYLTSWNSNELRKIELEW